MLFQVRLYFCKTQKKIILLGCKSFGITAAINRMKNIRGGDTICLVCVVKTLNANNSTFQSNLKVTTVLNKLIGKTWDKQPK